MFVIRPAMEISTVLYYQLHIDTIVEKYCVNKDRPQLNCNGKCFLMSELKKKASSSDKEDNAITLTEAFIPLFFQDTITQFVHENFDNNPQKKYWKLVHLFQKKLPKDIDHPPKHSSFQLKYS